jgi:hypothetical protein
MKIFTSILLIFLFLFTGIRISVSTHYCCGSAVATVVSLSGKTASCGMVSDNENSQKEISLRKHCCENKTSVYSIWNTFIPSFPIISDNDYHINVQELQFSGTSFSTYNDTLSFFSEAAPPGPYSATLVELPFICTFRI